MSQRADSAVVSPVAYVLVLHGGAGTIQPGLDEAPYHAGLRAALLAGEQVLQQGGSAVDAVIASAMALENNPLFNAGHGAVYTADATHELDAALMDGSSLAAGAVAGVKHVKNPILAAEAVLRDGRFVLLGGEGADQFAEQAGLVPVPNDYFSTALRRAQLRDVQAQAPDTTALDHSGVQARSSRTTPSDKGRFGTIGAVALDSHGHLAAATSTGGMTNKRPGRIGDTPLVGCGVYANDLTCAVSATGTGEHFIRAGIGFDVHARMQYGGASLEAAAQAAIHQSLAAIGGQGGIVAVARDGSVAMPFNTRGMYRGVVRAGQAPQTHIF